MFWPYYGIYYNRYYMIGTIFVILAALLAIWAQMKVSSTYSRYRKIANTRGISGAQAAREILDSEGLYDIAIYEVKGQLSDHFNPGKKTINLSSDVYHGTSIASLAVAAHECGHAIQYKEKYIPITLRNAILPIANVGQYLGWIAILIGLVLGQTHIAWFGFIAMCGILVFQLVTLPVEFDASGRALTILKSRYLTTSEYAGAKKMLSATAMTYVAAMISTLMSMLRIFLLILGNSRDE
ncbi:zinc metallopeptidase [Allocoprobacillus halotolerans]|uniref:Zinc metallopeptidase n=1 Tax=Allocoprobacillus halotolerans TaxID=2944914 RepID=A0ABY5I0W7_9FIRM|nr:zinc metallopeptidase [Allocoprobacillus halotolerans]UTY38989.1 zinc metallopeptidase [Allocoprobacillus halotolerans]